MKFTQKKLNKYIRSFLIMPLYKNFLFPFRSKSSKLNPVFIIGCGRSGTTILGRTLSKHPDICYLNERRDLWHRAYPEFDIWSGKEKNVKLFLNGEDSNCKKLNKLKELFFLEQTYAGKKTLVEKLPINNFRLEFLITSFPNAKFILLHRNGLEVARSISKKIPSKWFGEKDLKLKLLMDFAKQEGYQEVIDNVSSDFDKGLFEWRLSMEQSHKFFSNLDKSNFISLSYQDFVNNPYHSLTKILHFLDLDCNSALIDTMCKDIKRKSIPIKEIDTDKVRNIGGPFLVESIENTYSPQNSHL